MISVDYVLVLRVLLAFNYVSDCEHIRKCFGAILIQY